MKMRVLSVGCAVLLLVSAGIPARERNNDFYDDSPTRKLMGNVFVEVTGEVVKPGTVNLASLPVRSVIVREAVSEEEGSRFVGSYRYDGASLFDILKGFEVKKRNQEEFGSVIDMMVVVENKNHEKMVFSWGEIYYPNTHHRIIMATHVSRIVPSKTKEQWPLPKKVRMVCANDLISDRNLSDPVRITVMSSPLSFPVRKGMNPVYSEKVLLLNGKEPAGELTDLAKWGPELSYPAVFYGRGRGFHGIQYFRGKPLRKILAELFPVTRERIRQGYFVVSAMDGYRIVLGYSELMNRNDQCDFLIVDMKKKNKGRFRFFPAPDFFSDRAVFAVKSIHFMMI